MRAIFGRHQTVGDPPAFFEFLVFFVISYSFACGWNHWEKQWRVPPPEKATQRSGLFPGSPAFLFFFKMDARKSCQIEELELAASDTDYQQAMNHNENSGPDFRSICEILVDLSLCGSAPDGRIGGMGIPNPILQRPSWSYFTSPSWTSDQNNHLLVKTAVETIGGLRLQTKVLLLQESERLLSSWNQRVKWKWRVYSEGKNLPSSWSWLFHVDFAF